MDKYPGEYYHHDNAQDIRAVTKMFYGLYGNHNHNIETRHDIFMHRHDRWLMKFEMLILVRKRRYIYPLFDNVLTEDDNTE